MLEEERGVGKEGGVGRDPGGGEGGASFAHFAWDE